MRCSQTPAATKKSSCPSLQKSILSPKVARLESRMFSKRRIRSCWARCVRVASRRAHTPRRYLRHADWPQVKWRRTAEIAPVSARGGGGGDLAGAGRESAGRISGAAAGFGPGVGGALISSLVHPGSHSGAMGCRRVSDPAVVPATRGAAPDSARSSVWAMLRAPDAGAVARNELYGDFDSTSPGGCGLLVCAKAADGPWGTTRAATGCCEHSRPALHTRGSRRAAHRQHRSALVVALLALWVCGPFAAGIGLPPPSSPHHGVDRSQSYHQLHPITSDVPLTPVRLASPPRRPPR